MIRKIAIIAVALLLSETAVSIGTQTAFGVPTPYVVVSGSMVPTLQVGSIVMTQPVAYDNIKVGDIIVYYEPVLNVNVVHRVIQITPQGLITKGDANLRADEPDGWPPITPSQVRGEVLLSVPYVGLVSMDIPPLDRVFFALAIVAIVLASMLPRSARLRPEPVPTV